jgi:uncharacterized protein YjiS (DUF1127 family)
MTDLTASASTLRAPGFSLLAAFRAWRDARATERALSKLSDRELDDIGLCRGDITAIAYGTR